ncbi:MAG: beta-ketoacyl-ACP synthase II [Chitinophagales bacterium]
MSLKRVVITGLGAITPIGNTVPDFWKQLIDGKSGSNNITYFDTTHFRTQFACELKNYNPLDYFDKKELKKLDLFSQYAHIAADEAIKDSGLLDYADLNKKKVGVLVTSGYGGLNTFEEEFSDYIKNDKNPRYLSPFFIPRVLINLMSGNISIKYGFKGMNFSVVAACSSSSNALIDALNYIRLGKADAVVVGGAEAAITELGIGAFGAMKALSERNDEPQTASRPFDKNRDGFVMGEGAGCMMIESLEHAQKRGAKIYAEFAGGAMNADAYHITAPNPSGESIIDVMQEALEDACLQPSEIDYINVHGTSTPLGDIVEVQAIQKVFDEHVYQLNISSTKSMTGHLLGAAGILEAIVAVLSIQQNIVPPTINHFTDDDQFDNKINFTFHQKQERKVNAALSNNFGFGGHNVSIIFKKYVD